MESIIELFEEPSIYFKKHLEEEENDRILFSGIYGIGKTTFLKYFFNTENRRENYNVIHLFPVNYSVLSNEDILSYIKYDIFYELAFKSGQGYTERDLSFIGEAPKSIRREIHKVYAMMLKGFSKIGKGLFNLKKEMDDLEQVFFKYSNHEESAIEIQSLMANQFIKEGSLYDYNIFTQLIQLKLETTGKKNVLIIDDLDRIDPSHIFRIFNVFSSYFDEKNLEFGNKNKFGFDHVIFVCDVKNIREIFKSKYGGNVDFNGYIDKFYSNDIYYFDNSNGILSVLEKLIESINFFPDDEKRTTFLNGIIDMIDVSLIYIFSELIRIGQINLRSLLKYHKKTLKIPFKELPETNKFRKHGKNYQNPIVILIQILYQHFSDFEKLKAAISTCKNLQTGFRPSNYQYLIESTLPLIIEKGRSLESPGYHDKFSNSFIEFKLRSSNILNTSGTVYNASISNVTEKINGAGKQRSVNDLNYFHFLELVIIELERLGYFN